MALALDVRSAVPALLETLKLRDRRCVVVGAAPLDEAGYGAVDRQERIVAVNGGISSVPAGFTVDVWAVNAHVTDPSPMTRLMRQQGQGRHVRCACLILREPDAGPCTVAKLRARETVVDDYVEVSADDRTAIERVSGARVASMTKHALSAGFFTVAACLVAGARSVRLVGFSWEPGYAYLPESTWNRGHVHADRLALKQLQARYGPRLQTTLIAQE